MLASIKSFSIAFLVAVLIFGVTAYYTYPYIENDLLAGFDAEKNEGEQSGEQTDVPVTEDVLQPPTNTVEGSSFTTLFVIHNRQNRLFNDYRVDIEANKSATIEELAQNSRRYRADVIVLMRCNAESQTYMFTAMPTDTLVSVGELDMKLGYVYEQFGMNTLIDVVQASTSLPIDNYILLDFDTFKSAIDTLGGVEFNVPQDMSDVYEEESTGGAMYTISLKKGTQRLDGDKALQLLRYEKYGDLSKGRASVAAKFLKSLADEYFNANGFAAVKNAFGVIKNSPDAKTDMDTKTLEDNRALIEGYSRLTQKVEEFRGSYQVIDGENTFIFGYKEMYNVFSHYKD